MTNSRITSNLFSFTSNSIKADTADYNLKSLTTNGYSFIAENANTNINFDLKMSNFHLNTDSSLVKFPEITVYLYNDRFYIQYGDQGPEYGTERKIKYSAADS